MAVTRQTLRLAAGIRVRLDATVDDTTRALVREWARAWNELSADWTDVADDIVAAGGKLRRRDLLKARRVQRALTATRDALDELGKTAGVTILETVPETVAAAAADQAEMLATQYPKSVAAVGLDFARVDDRALAAIVKRSTGQITSTLKPVAGEVQARIRSQLIRGVAVGNHPDVAARRMVRGLEERFNWGLTRAMTVARTEMLDAHRAGGMAQDKANSDVVTGWVWQAALTIRTCEGCWGMHGTEHPLTEAGPDGHQNCRCARTPLLKPWSELGFDIAEPASLMPDAEATFFALPAGDQLAIMGQRRIDMLRSGDIAWRDLATVRSTDGWRDSIVPTPLKDLERRAAA